MLPFKNNSQEAGEVVAGQLVDGMVQGGVGGHAWRGFGVAGRRVALGQAMMGRAPVANGGVVARRYNLSSSSSCQHNPNPTDRLVQDVTKRVSQ